MKEFWKDNKNIDDMGRVVNDFHKERLCGMLADH